MGNYTIFKMFKNHRRGRQARNFTINVPEILDLNCLPNRYFPKIDVGCPCVTSLCYLWAVRKYNCKSGYTNKNEIKKKV